MTNELISQEQINQKKAMLSQMAENAGEKGVSFISIPTISVFNQDPNNKSTDFSEGDLVITKKVDKDYIKNKYTNPFYGIILKTRMQLKAKPGEVKKGADMLISNEFDSYTTDIITVKKKDYQGKYVVDFTGTYKEVKENYTETLRSGAKAYALDLHHSIYVLVNIEEPTIIKIDAKGTSRSEYFDYMNSFDRSVGEHMIGIWTEFGSKLIEKDWQGNALRFPVYAMSFTKSKEFSFDDLKKVQSIQNEFNRQLEEMEEAFSKSETKKLSEGEQPEPKDDGSQEIAEEIPVINIDEEDEVKIEDVPFN